MKVQLEQVTEWLWRLETPVVNAYALKQSEGLALIDSGTAGQADAILNCLGEALALPPEQVPLTEIMLTHCHADHIGSAAALAERTGARVSGPAVEADIIEGRAAPERPRLLDWEVPVFDQVMPQVPPAPPVKLDVRLSPGDELSWDPRAEVIAAPGHTPGQLAVWFPAERVLIATDAIASQEGNPMIGVFNADPQEATVTYSTLAALEPDIACFGHGDPLVGGAGLLLKEHGG